MNIKSKIIYFLVLLPLLQWPWQFPLQAQENQRKNYTPDSSGLFYLSPFKDDGNIIYIHSVGDKAFQWRGKFYRYFQEKNSPPPEWMELSRKSFGGIWLNRSKLGGDLKDYGYRDVQEGVHFSRKYQSANSILVAFRIKEGARWWFEGPLNRKTWQDWIKNPKNLARPNTFNSQNHKFIGKERFPMHSAFYEDYNIAGVFMDGFTPVLQNFDMVREGAVYVSSFVQKDQEPLYFENNLPLRELPPKEGEKDKKKNKFWKRILMPLTLKKWMPSIPQEKCPR